jgi:hypothetical protein
VTLVPSDSLLLFTNRRLCDDLDRTTQAIYSPRRRRAIYLTVDIWPTPEPYYTIFNGKVRGDTPYTRLPSFQISTFSAKYSLPKAQSVSPR